MGFDNENSPAARSRYSLAASKFGAARARLCECGAAVVWRRRQCSATKRASYCLVPTGNWQMRFLQ